MQNFLVQKAAANFSAKLGTKVQIASVDYALFNKVLFEQVYIEDQSNDTLLFIKELKMGFSPFKLIQNKIVCNYLELKTLSGNLVLNEDKKLNLTFILDALKEDKKESKLVYQIEGIKIVNSKISYTNKNSSFLKRTFDTNNIYIRDLNAKINLHKLSKDELSLDIDHISFTERSGFKLDNFTATINANKEELHINKLAIQLPNSEVSFTPICIEYGSLSDLKELNEKVQFDFAINPSEIALADLKSFIPAFKRNKEKIKVSTNFTGSIGNIKIKNLKLSYDNDISLRGDLNFNGLPNIDETFIHTRIKSIKTDKIKLQDLLSDISGKPFLLPKEFSNLGTIRYSGNISGFFSDLVVFGSLKTKAGDIYTDILMGISPDFKEISYSGSLHAQNFKLGSILDKNSKAGDITFNISSQGSIRSKGNIKGIVEGDIASVVLKNYVYKNILLKGEFDRKVFDGWIGLDDEYAKLDFQGKIDLSDRLPSGKFKMVVDKLNLNKLHLIKDHPNLSMAFNINTSFTGSKIEETDTDILIDSLYIFDQENELFSEKVYIQSTINDSISILQINSDLVNGTVKGKYSFLSLGKSISNMISHYLPSAIKKQDNKQSGNNDFVFYLTDFHVDELANILNLNLSLSPNTLISGFYNNASDKFRLEVLIPEMKKGKKTYNDLRFICNNKTDAIKISSSTSLNKDTKINFASSIANDSIQLNLDWNNPHNFSGKFNSITLLDNNDDKKLHASIDILPSKIWLKDSLWNVHLSTLETDFKTLQVTDFLLDHNDQFIKINGTASNSTSDSLFVKVNDVLLANIMDIVKVRTPKIEGLVTGECYIMNVFDKMILEMDLFAEDFTFNNSLWGDVKMKSVWDGANKKLNAKAYAITAEKDTAFHLAGGFFPKRDSMEFVADINKLDIDFLRYYLDGALKNISGDASGKLRIFGGLRHFEFDGDLLVKNGYFDVDFLKTSYHFTDTIRVRKEAVIFDDITLYDFKNNKGQLNGSLTHKNFKDMHYRFDVNCNNVLAMNTLASDNENFYGTAYGTGRVRIVGNYQDVDFTINMRTEKNTKVVIPMETTEIATENSFVQFVNHKSSSKNRNTKESKELEKASETNIHVYLQLEATPDGEIKLITDPIGGDYVRVEGYGNLRIDYDNIEGNKLYGDYEVERGDYFFTLQQVVKKTFMVKSGGTIRWTGDPYEAIIDLNATYTVPSVSLLDILQEGDLSDAGRTSLAVNCLLNLTGDLMTPTIKFDLELPSDPELQRRIKNIVNTDEMMNREMLALLVMNRFYKPDYLQDEGTGLATEAMSVLTTTVSGQLNNWFSKLNDKVNVGLNARLSNGVDFTEGGEYKLGVMFQPNSRLIINSNLGYRDDIYNLSTTNFIGDVDVEYKLNKSGKVRAKAYTHSADNYFINTQGTAISTQGLGIMYREDFDNFSDVLRYYFKKDSKKNDSIKKK